MSDKDTTNQSSPQGTGEQGRTLDDLFSAPAIAPRRGHAVSRRRTLAQNAAAR